MNRRTRRRLTGLLVFVAVVLIAIFTFWPEVFGLTGSDEPVSPTPVDTNDIPSDTGPDYSLPGPPVELGNAETQAAYQDGLKLLAEEKLIAARNKLSEALFSGKLAEGIAEKVRQRLTELADKTLFSRQVSPGDPYALHYTFKSGEQLRLVERNQQLHVPYELILNVNRIANARNIRAGDSYKFIRGPFHAIVTKSNFTMDVYLQRQGLPRVFVKRMRVGLGRNDSTPEGLWHVAYGKKMAKASWNPPPETGLRGTIPWGHPDYPLGKEGYWIGLDGIDENNAHYEGYGIHGTNDPATIGAAGSLGCIRLSDEDIELLYSLLYEVWSTVEVRP